MTRCAWLLLLAGCGRGAAPDPVVEAPVVVVEEVPPPAPPSAGLTLRVGERVVIRGTLRTGEGGRVVVLPGGARLVGGGPGTPARTAELLLLAGDVAALGADGSSVVVAGTLMMVEENRYAGPALRDAALAAEAELTPVVPSAPPAAEVGAMMQGSGELLPLTPPETLGGWLRRVRGAEPLTVVCEPLVEARFVCRTEAGAAEQATVEVERGPVGWRLVTGSAKVGPK